MPHLWLGATEKHSLHIGMNTQPKTWSSSSGSRVRSCNTKPYLWLGATE